MQWISSLITDSSTGFLQALATPPEGSALVEIRLDLFPGIDIAAAVAASPLPVLATLRSEFEGGRGPNDPQDRERILAEAVAGGADLIDLEWARDRRLIHAFGLPPEKIVMSWHDMSGTPENLLQTAVGLLAEPVSLAKMVPTARNLGDLAHILSLLTDSGISNKRDRRRLIAFAMGSVGAPSRYLSPLLGAPVGFTAWSADTPAAPGQQTPQRMNAVVGHLQGPPQRVFGVVGVDVAGSLSPVLHGAAFAASRTPDVMLPVSVPQSAELEKIFKPFGETLFDRLNLPVHGWAVTTPYKIEAAKMATHAAPRVVRAGAANTLILKPSRIIAENTDADGVVGSLTAAGYSIVGTTALIQGVGGAARGAAIGLHLAGADVVLRGRNAERTKKVADSLGLNWCDSNDRTGAEILVNATPLGREAEDGLPFTRGEIEMAGAVVDMVYGATKTTLVSIAEESGLTVVDGRTMLAYQGMAQFAAFTTTTPPREAMLRSVGAR